MVLSPSPITHISFSSLSLFLSSRVRWHRKYVLGIQDEAVSPAMIEGKALHKHAELCILGHDPLASLNMAKAIIESAAQMGTVDWGETGSLEKSLDTLEKLAVHFVDAKDALGIKEIIDVENSETVKLPGVKLPVKGIIDLVYRDGSDRLMIADWKTTRSFSDCLKPKHLIQGMLYAMMIQKKYKQKPYLVKFVEIKASTNKDGSPQFRLLDLVPDKEREKQVKGLFNHVIREMTRKQALYLPNLSDLNPEDDWAAYIEQYGE